MGCVCTSRSGKSSSPRREIA